MYMLAVYLVWGLSIDGSLPSLRKKELALTACVPRSFDLRFAFMLVMFVLLLLLSVNTKEDVVVVVSKYNFTFLFELEPDI